MRKNQAREQIDPIPFPCPCVAKLIPTADTGPTMVPVKPSTVPQQLRSNSQLWRKGRPVIRLTPYDSDPFVRLPGVTTSQFSITKGMMPTAVTPERCFILSGRPSCLLEGCLTRRAGSTWAMLQMWRHCVNCKQFITFLGVQGQKKNTRKIHLTHWMLSTDK